MRSGRTGQQWRLRDLNKIQPLKGSVGNPGCLSRYPTRILIFWFPDPVSQIMDPGSRTKKKGEGGNFWYLNFFCRLKFHKIVNSVTIQLWVILTNVTNKLIVFLTNVTNKLIVFLTNMTNNLLVFLTNVTNKLLIFPTNVTKKLFFISNKRD